MKIVHVEDFFHPEAGYQLNILSKYMSSMGHDVTVITAELEKISENLTSFFGKEDIEQKDRKFEEENGVKIIRVPVKAYISGRVIYSGRLQGELDKICPDVLYVHGNDTAVGMKYIRKVRRLKYKLITDNHMLEMASQNPLRKTFRFYYRHFVTPAIIKYKIPVIRTQDDDYVKRCLGIPLKYCPLVSFGSDTLLFHPDGEVKSRFRQRHQIPEDALVFIYAGKLDWEKGGKLLGQAFLNKFNTDREIVLLVVGNTVGDYGKEVETLFQKSENRIERFPTQKYTALPEFYQAADIAVFPRQCSLSFYDVQSCGLPVISEDNNINVDRCSHENGFNFKAESVEDFRNKIQGCISLEEEGRLRLSRNAREFIEKNYDYRDIVKQYMKIIEEGV